MNKEQLAKEILEHGVRNGLSDGEIITNIEKEIGKPILIPNEEKINCACGYPKLQSDMPTMISPVVGVVCNNICSGCIKTYEDACSLCCATCKSTFMHFLPRKAASGYEYKKGRIYHTEHCPNCAKQATGARIIEEYLWCSKNNIPTTHDPNHNMDEKSVDKL